MNLSNKTAMIERSSLVYATKRDGAVGASLGAD